MRTDYPWTWRLARVEQRTELETKIADIMMEIEQLGASPILTDAGAHLMQALCALGAWTDAGKPGH